MDCSYLPNVPAEIVLQPDKLTLILPASAQLPPHAFNRENDDADAAFYEAPRLHHHMDPAARYALRLFYEDEFDGIPAPSIVEIFASWASHLPELREYGPVIGVGLNAEELSRNGNLTAYVVHDLNASPIVSGIAEAALRHTADPSVMPREPENGTADGTSTCGPFDFATCVLGLEYMVRPIDVFSQVLCQLRPGGKCIVAFTAKFLTAKTVRVWIEASTEQRIWLAATYLHLARVPGDTWRFASIEALDLSPDPGRSDPLYVIKAVKTRFVAP